MTVNRRDGFLSSASSCSMTTEADYLLKQEFPQYQISQFEYAFAVLAAGIGLYQASF